MANRPAFGRHVSGAVRGVKGVMPVLAAGGTFATATLAGFFAGVWLAGRFRMPVVAVAGLFVGLVLGGYSAYRLLMRSV